MHYCSPICLSLANKLSEECLHPFDSRFPPPFETIHSKTICGIIDSYALVFFTFIMALSVGSIVSCGYVQLAVGRTASERSGGRGRDVRHALDRETVSGGHERCERKSTRAFIVAQRTEVGWGRLSNCNTTAFRCYSCVVFSLLLCVLLLRGPIVALCGLTAMSGGRGFSSKPNAHSLFTRFFSCDVLR